jgi:hypothetical protein
MTFKEYYKLNKRALRSLFKILGIVFTSLYSILFIIFAMSNKNELIDGLYVFILCFILGNFLAVSISIRNGIFSDEITDSVIFKDTIRFKERTRFVIAK